MPASLPFVEIGVDLLRLAARVDQLLAEPAAASVHGSALRSEIRNLNGKIAEFARLPVAAGSGKRTRKELRDAVQAAVLFHPDWSVRRLARFVGCSRVRVHAFLKELAENPVDGPVMLNEAQEAWMGEYAETVETILGPVIRKLPAYEGVIRSASNSAMRRMFAALDAGRPRRNAAPLVVRVVKRAVAEALRDET